MEFAAYVNGTGCDSRMKIFIDSEDGEEIGECVIGRDGGVVKTVVKNVTGRHALFFKVETDYTGWTSDMFAGRNLFEFKSFVFMKNN